MRVPYKVEQLVQESIRFVCVAEPDEGGGMHDNIVQLVTALSAAMLIAPGDRLLYRDTGGIWDEILLDAECRYDGFRPLGALTREGAIRQALGERT